MNMTAKPSQFSRGLVKRESDWFEQNDNDAPRKSYPKTNLLENSLKVKIAQKKS